MVFDGKLIDPQEIVDSVVREAVIAEVRAELSKLQDEHMRVSEAGRALRRLPVPRNSVNPHEARAAAFAAEANAMLARISETAMHLAEVSAPYLAEVGRRLDAARVEVYGRLAKVMSPGMRTLTDGRSRFELHGLSVTGQNAVMDLLSAADAIEVARKKAGSRSWLIRAIRRDDEIDWGLVIQRVKRFAR